MNREEGFIISNAWNPNYDTPNTHTSQKSQEDMQKSMEKVV
jgi:hypothetical protein